MPNSNDSRPWGAIREIDAAEMPPDKASKWWPLFQELHKRLEQTTEHFALAVPITDGRIEGAKASLQQNFRRRKGKGSVSISTAVDESGVPTLYVRRGPNWK